MISSEMGLCTSCAAGDACEVGTPAGLSEVVDHRVENAKPSRRACRLRCLLYAEQDSAGVDAR